MLAILALFFIETRFIEYREPWPLLASGDSQGLALIKLPPRIAQNTKVQRLMNIGTGLGTLIGGR